MFIVTLIAADRLSVGDISTATDRLFQAGCAPGSHAWIDEGIACDIPFATDPAAALNVLDGSFSGIDVIAQPREGRSKQLLVSDMDSTMITVECIDELADYAGLRAEISAVTESAMRGELDFEAALDARVALLRGMSAATLEECYRERVVLMPGAVTLVRTMRARGARTVLVSGGFTHFADPVAHAIGFDRAVSNVLGITGGALDGTVVRPIVGAEAKRALLISERTSLGLNEAATMAIGDGANDIPMIEEAGFGIAYRAKAKAAAAADARITFNDLTAALYAQGISRQYWSEG